MIVMFTLALGGAAYMLINLKRENNRLEPRAKKYDEICAAVKSALWVNMTLLHDTDNPPRLTPAQVETDRRMLYEKVGATIGGDDSYVMLQRCMPQPFPMDAWDGCRSKNDDVCLRRILKQAMESIP
jgi:hypothetical protein